MVQQGTRFGLADHNGRLVLPAEDKSIEPERQHVDDTQLVRRQRTTNTPESVTIPNL